MAAQKKLLSLGNGKLDKSILGWSITPIKSCLNCKDCKDTCYALAPYKRWPVVKTAWDRNFFMAHDGSFVDPIIDQLTRAKKATAVRIHVAGDFFNQTYLDSWTHIVKMFPHLNFYGYTKVMDRFDFSALVALPNMNLINSIADDGGINFGDAARVQELVEMGYSICPATVPGADVHCGGEGCTICQTTNKVCFHQHK